MFSSTTTESSIKRENASASPPSSMVLMVPPIAFITSRQTKAESGIDNNTANVARVNAASLATFASAPGEPTNVVFPEVKITNGFNDNFSVISWQAPAGAPADTTYEVVWRPTDAPTWTNVKSAGSALTLKLDISKDNVVFGVRSVDAAGHRSPAVVPYPVRRATMSPSAPRKTK